MTAELDRDVAPVWIEDVKGVVVHIRHRPLAVQMMLPADVPDRGLRPPDEDEQDAFGHGRRRQVLLGEVMLALARAAIDDRHAVVLRVGADPDD